MVSTIANGNIIWLMGSLAYKKGMLNLVEGIIWLVVLHCALDGNWSIGHLLINFSPARLKGAAAIIRNTLHVVLFLWLGAKCGN